MINMRRMTEDEYVVFRGNSITDYAGDLMKEGRPEEQAREEAQEEFESMLPRGRETEDQFLMMIDDAESGKNVGWIWYMYELNEEGSKQVFLNDFLIEEAERRKGYAAAALAEMERRAAADGCRESVLYVWEHNQPGISLYLKCGYTVCSRQDDGQYMKKTLG